MTIPTLTNCPHSGDGWCLECVRKLATECESAERERGLAIDEADAALAYIRVLACGVDNPVVANHILNCQELDRYNAARRDRTASGGAR